MPTLSVTKVTLSQCCLVLRKLDHWLGLSGSERQSIIYLAVSTHYRHITGRCRDRHAYYVCV